MNGWKDYSSFVKDLHLNNSEWEAMPTEVKKYIDENSPIYSLLTRGGAFVRPTDEENIYEFMIVSPQRDNRLICKHETFSIEDYLRNKFLQEVISERSGIYELNVKKDGYSHEEYLAALKLNTACDVYAHSNYKHTVADVIKKACELGIIEESDLKQDLFRHNNAETFEKMFGMNDFQYEEVKRTIAMCMDFLETFDYISGNSAEEILDSRSSAMRDLLHYSTDFDIKRMYESMSDVLWTAIDCVQEDFAEYDFKVYGNYYDGYKILVNDIEYQADLSIDKYTIRDIDKYVDNIMSKFESDIKNSSNPERPSGSCLVGDYNFKFSEFAFQYQVGLYDTETDKHSYVGSKLSNGNKVDDLRLAVKSLVAAYSDRLGLESYDPTKLHETNEFLPEFFEDCDLIEIDFAEAKTVSGFIDFSEKYDNIVFNRVDKDCNLREQLDMPSDMSFSEYAREKDREEENSDGTWLNCYLTIDSDKNATLNVTTNHTGSFHIDEVINLTEQEKPLFFEAVERKLGMSLDTHFALEENKAKASASKADNAHKKDKTKKADDDNFGR